MSVANEKPKENKENSWLKKAAAVTAATAITIGAAAITFGDDIVEVVEKATKSKKNTLTTIVTISAVTGVVAIALELLLNPDEPKKQAQIFDHIKLQDPAQRVGAQH